MATYAKKLTKRIDHSKPFVLIGLSFGGMLATEIAKIYQPRKLILISTAATASELRPMYKFVVLLQLNKLIPSIIFRQRGYVLSKLFQSEHRELLYQIAIDSDRQLTKQFINMILTWNNQEYPKNSYRIHGERDLVIPCPEKVDLKIKGGGHLIILDEAAIVSKSIQQFLE